MIPSTKTGQLTTLSLLAMSFIVLTPKAHSQIENLPTTAETTLTHTFHANPTLVAESDQNYALRLDREESLVFARFSAKWEFDNNDDDITSWNEGENFASVGIGHYLWYPQYSNPQDQPPYEESFPSLIKFMAQGCNAGPFPHVVAFNPQTLKIAKCPWRTRKSFYDSFRSEDLRELRTFLLSTDSQFCQVQYQLSKLNDTLNAITGRSSVRALIDTLVLNPRGVRALLDYSNFKGTGLNPDENYQGFRWGLKQVLEDAAIDFEADSSFDEAFTLVTQSAKNRLTKRAAIQESVAKFLTGWLARISGY